MNPYTATTPAARPAAKPRTALCHVPIRGRFKARLQAAAIFTRGHYCRTRRAYHCKRHTPGDKQPVGVWLEGGTMVFPE